MMGRPNPEGWKGGSEDFDTVWTLNGHRADGVGLHFDVDHDPCAESGITIDRYQPNDTGQE